MLAVLLLNLTDDKEPDKPSGGGIKFKEPVFRYDEEPEERKKRDEVLLLGVHLWN